MRKKYNVHFDFGDPVLTHLISEQVGIDPLFTHDTSLPADFSFIKEGGKLPESAAYIIIPNRPIRLGEYMDQLKYQLSGRDHHIEEDQSLDLGKFVFYPGKNRLIHQGSGDIVHLTDKERLFLRVLYEADGQPCSRIMLLQKIWGYAKDAETHTIETHIYRLRQKLDPYDGGQELVKSDGGGSYFLNIKSGL